LLDNKDLFRKGKLSSKNYMCTCPYHKEGNERKSSFGVSLENGVCHCFACGWAGALDRVISNVLFNVEDDGLRGREWLTKEFLTVSVEARKPLKLNTSRRGQVEQKETVGFTEGELDSYRYVHPYMYERGLTDEIIEEFDIGYDVVGKCLTFPVYDIDKNPIFIARRSVKGKFFNYPEGVQKPVYVAYRFVDGLYGRCVICESILNALTCWKFGIPAVALMGTGTNEQYSILKQLPVRKYIIATDPDEAGRRASLKLRDALCSSKVITNYDIPVGEDMNSLDEKILKLSEYF
jgi:DNA primase